MQQRELEQHKKSKAKNKLPNHLRPPEQHSSTGVLVGKFEQAKSPEDEHDNIIFVNNGVMIVADGLRKESRGKTAAQMVINAFSARQWQGVVDQFSHQTHTELEIRNALRSELNDTLSQVHQEIAQRSDADPITATVVILVKIRGKQYAASLHVGNTRLAIYRPNKENKRELIYSTIDDTILYSFLAEIYTNRIKTKDKNTARKICLNIQAIVSRHSETCFRTSNQAGKPITQDDILTEMLNSIHTTDNHLMTYLFPVENRQLKNILKSYFRSERKGDKIKLRYYKGITKTIGDTHTASSRVEITEIFPGDILIASTDGVHRSIDIEGYVKETQHTDPQTLAGQIVQRAQMNQSSQTNELAGSPDDMAIGIIFITSQNEGDEDFKEAPAAPEETPETHEKDDIDYEEAPRMRKSTSAEAPRYAHEESQDRVHVTQSLMIVCDGIGKNNQSRKAADITIKAFEKFDPQEYINEFLQIGQKNPEIILKTLEKEIKRRLQDAQTQIYEEGRNSYPHMATTVAVACLVTIGNKTYLTSAHLGDTRIFVGQINKVNKNDPDEKMNIINVSQITPDHSMLHTYLAPLGTNSIKTKLQLEIEEAISYFTELTPDYCHNTTIEMTVISRIITILKKYNVTQYNYNSVYTNVLNYVRAQFSSTNGANRQEKIRIRKDRSAITHSLGVNQEIDPIHISHREVQKGSVIVGLTDGVYGNIHTQARVAESLETAIKEKDGQVNPQELATKLLQKAKENVSIRHERELILVHGPDDMSVGVMVV